MFHWLIPSNKTQIVISVVLFNAQKFVFLNKNGFHTSCLLFVFIFLVFILSLWDWTQIKPRVKGRFLFVVLNIK